MKAPGARIQRRPGPAPPVEAHTCWLSLSHVRYKQCVGVKLAQVLGPLLLGYFRHPSLQLWALPRCHQKGLVGQPFVGPADMGRRILASPCCWRGTSLGLQKRRGNQHSSQTSALVPGRTA